MMTRRLTAKAEIQAYLETDRDYAAYAIGDLDEGFFGRCEWYAAEEDGETCALALVYCGFSPPVLFLMGAGKGVAALLSGPAPVERAYVTARQEHLAALGAYYDWDELYAMWRMTLRPENLARPGRLESIQHPRRLDDDDVDCLRVLYAFGGGDAFSGFQLSQGVFYGVEQDERLVAAAGTHLVSEAYSVGAVGNVMTHPDYRGCQYATLSTYAVCAELIRRGVTTIVLNVRQDNAPALRVYEKLGFVRRCPFYEGVIERR